MKHLLTFLFFILIQNFAFADSPLTSCDFYQEYEKLEIFQSARNSNNHINQKCLIFLADSTNSLEIKLALINAIGWNIKGRDNSKKYLKYLSRIKHKKITLDTIQEYLDANELICYAYLKSLDDYFNVTKSFEIAEMAIKKSPNNFSIHLIASIIHAQIYMDQGKSCEMYTAVNNVVSSASLKRTFSDTAVNSIMEYMTISKKGCPL
jgi:hypothetical protein